MGLIPQITCRRCGAKFSALRRRCPSCGTRRVQQSSRVPGTTPSAVKGTAANARVNTNRKWQLIFAAILVVAVIIALIVMITVSLNEEDNADSASKIKAPEVTVVPTPTPTPTPTPKATPTVTELTICYFSEERTEFSANVGDKTPLVAEYFPLTIENPQIKWSTSDDSVIQLIPDPDNPAGVTVVGRKSGSATLTAQCYGATAEVSVYIN